MSRLKVDVSFARTHHRPNLLSAMLDFVTGLLPANPQSLIGVKGSYLIMTPSLPGIPLDLLSGVFTTGLKKSSRIVCHYMPLEGTS